MYSKILRAVTIGGFGALAISLGACTTTLTPRPDYVSAGLSAPVVQGKAVVVMDEAFQRLSVTQHPDSYTGSATSLNVPIGAIIATAGDKVFDKGFSGGSEVATTARGGAYDVALRLDGFSYKYDQLSNLGFAITPKVTIALTSEVTGPEGKSLLRKRYERKDFTVGTYVLSMKPTEKINQSLHLALAELFRDMLDDVVKVKASPTTATSQ